MELELSTYPSMATKHIIPMLRLSLSKALDTVDGKRGGKRLTNTLEMLFMARLKMLLDYQWDAAELQVRIYSNGKLVMNINPYDDEQVRGFLTWAVITYMEGNT